MRQTRLNTWKAKAKFKKIDKEKFFKFKSNFKISKAKANEMKCDFIEEVFSQID